MRRLHRFAAIVAAYAIALQALFGAFAVPAHLAFADAAICQSNPDSGAPQPNHDACCPGCLAGHCAHLLLGTSRVTTFVPWPASAAPVGTGAHDGAIPIRIADNAPHAARAPPAG
jgi:hypothetical protein